MTVLLLTTRVGAVLVAGLLLIALGSILGVIP